MADTDKPDDDEPQVPARLARNMAVELGSTGLKRYQDDYARLEEEWLPQLRGDFALAVYREMSQNDPIVGAFLFTIDMLVRKIEWRVDPFDETEKHAKNAEFVEECMQDMDMAWSDVISEVMSFLVYGWSALEIVYKRRNGSHDDGAKHSRFDDGRIGWSTMPIRAQDTLNGWKFGPGNRVLGMRQFGPPHWDDVLIPANKFVLFRTVSRRNSPEGVSILRTAYRAWWFKKRLEEIEGIGIERDLAGLPIAYVPPRLMGPAAKLNEGELALRDSLQRLVQNVRRDRQEGILFPREFDVNGNEMFGFELLSTGGARQFNTNEVISRYEARIAMTVLADFLLLGTQNVGSWALSTDKVNLFNEALKTWTGMIADAFNRQAIPRLFRLNGMDDSELPRISPNEIVTPNLSEIGDFITKLSSAGFTMFPNEDFEDYLFELARFPEIPDAVREEQEQEKLMAQQQAQLGMAAMGQDVKLKGAQSKATEVGAKATEASIEQTKANVEATRESARMMRNGGPQGAAGGAAGARKPAGATAPRKRATKAPRKPT